MIYLTPRLSHAFSESLLVNGSSPLLRRGNRIVLLHLVLHVCTTHSSFPSIERAANGIVLTLPNTFTSTTTSLNSRATNIFPAGPGSYRYGVTTIRINEKFLNLVAASAAMYLNGRPRCVGAVNYITRWHVPNSVGTDMCTYIRTTCCDFDRLKTC